MKVCFITCHYPPLSRTYRRYQFARYLADGGCQVEVITHGNISRALGAWVDDPDLAAQAGDIPVHRPRALPWHLSGELLYRAGLIACPYMNWRRSATRAACRVAATRSDVVVGVYPPLTNLIAAYCTARRTGARLVVDFRDEYLGLARGVRRRLARKWQARLVAAADLVSTATPAIARTFAERDGLPGERLHITENGYFDDPGEPPPPPGGDRVRIVYAGAISAIQGVDVLCQALGVLRRGKPRLAERVRASIYGPDNAYRRAVLSKALVPGVEYGGYLSAGEVSGRLHAADVCFLSLSSRDYGYAIPGKLYEYIAHGRPILAALPPGAARDLIESEGLGLVADCRNPADLARQLERILDPMVRQGLARVLAEKRARYAAAPNFISLSRRIQAL